MVPNFTPALVPFLILVTKIEDEKLLAAFLKVSSRYLDRTLEGAGFATEGNPHIDAKLYGTEAADRLYVKFDITHQCSDLTGEGRTDGVLVSTGDGSYDMSKEEFVDLQNHGQKLTYNDKNGEQKVQNSVLVAGIGEFGHRSVHHTVRFSLDSEA